MSEAEGRPQPQQQPAAAALGGLTVALGQRLKLRGRLDDAERVFKTILRTDEKNKDAWLALALLNRDRERLDDAGYCMWRASRLDPTNRRLLNDLGTILIRRKDYSRAATVFSSILKDSHDDLQAFINLSVIRRSMGQEAMARRIFETGLSRKAFWISKCILPKPEGRILRIQGVQNSDFVVARIGFEPELLLTTGNFPTERFWNEGRFTTISYLIFGDNLNNERSLPSHDVIVNTIADPDVEAEALRSLLRFVKRRPKTPVINDPQRVLESGRDRNYQRLKRRPGVLFPKTVRVKLDAVALKDPTVLLTRHEVGFPLLLRVPGARTGQRFAKVANAEEMARFVKEVGRGDLYLIEYVDCPHRDGFYCRMRVFFIDGEIYPVSHHVDDKWNVSGEHRAELMKSHPWMVDEERAFMSDPRAFLGAETYDRLQALNETVKLDFFGVDFAIAPNGDLMIYELNPMMRHSFDYGRAFPYLMPYLQRISAAFQQMIVKRVQASLAPKRAAAGRMAARAPAATA